MTKKEIYDIEQSNDGKVYLYPEGMFYKAYDRSAFLLCSCVRSFKVSVRPLKGIDAPLLSVGFPMSSLEKFSDGAQVLEAQSMGGVKCCSSLSRTCPALRNGRLI